MPYFEVNFDPFIALGKITNSPVSNPLNLLSFVESVGAAGISFTYGPETGQMNNVALLRSMTNCRINIRVPADMQVLQKAILLRPDIVTLCDMEKEDTTVQIPSKSIKELVNSVLNIEDLGIAIRLKPDVKQLKEAYQMGIDEIEIATNELARHDKQTPFLECLEKITHTIHIGNKNNLRISAGGELDRRLIRALNEVIDVEFISVGKALLSRSLMWGLENALKEFNEVIDIR
ncbi:MAG: pyridoxine 5'-phosphate synthase [Candidatus Marinimicrobia bacterium]|nr:pyridoxine 5'-phosphate synthase [Candidatus Neomarinimicrobiota bacterium]